MEWHEGDGAKGVRRRPWGDRVGRAEIKTKDSKLTILIVQELCESRGGRPGLSVLTSLLVSLDVKLY